MTSHRDDKKGSLIPALLMGAGALYAWQELGPIMSGSVVNWPVAAAAGACVLSGAVVARSLFASVADLLEVLAARSPTGLRGTAGFVKSLEEIKGDLIRYGWGPYWGAVKKKPVVAAFEASAYVLGPSGSGKTSKAVIQQILALAMAKKDKCIIDFKPELTPVLAELLRTLGESVKIINLGNQYTEIVGEETDEYNPLHLVADLFWEDGGLFEISDLLQEMCLQLFPEPAGKGGTGSAGDNKHFRDGSRRLINFAIQTCVLIQGHNATIGDVLQLLSSRTALLQHAQWAAGRLEIEEESHA